MTISALPPSQSGAYDEIGWHQLIEHLQPNNLNDVRIRHAHEYKSNIIPGGAIVGKNVFGKNITADSINSIPPYRMAPPIESYIVHEGILLPSSMLALDRHFRIIDVFFRQIGSAAALSYDWNFQIGGDEELSFTERFFDDLEYCDEIAIPLGGTGISNYGHFLFDGLPAALLFRSLVPEKHILLATQALQPWQAKIIDLLGLSSSIISIHKPTRFAKLIVSSFCGGHVPYPSRYLRVVYDMLKFRIGADGDAGGSRIFVSRRSDSKRPLRNRAEVEELLTSLGFVIVEPVFLNLEEQARIFSNARFIVAEAGAAMANLGFCDPGAVVLEIATSLDPWTRGQCHQLGLRWRGFIAEKSQSDEDIPAHDRPSFTVDCATLSAAIALLEAEGDG